MAKKEQLSPRMRLSRGGRKGTWHRRRCPFCGGPNTPERSRQGAPCEECEMRLGDCSLMRL
jgi:hypothetical protein